MTITIDMSELKDSLAGLAESDEQSLAVLVEIRDLLAGINGLLPWLLWSVGVLAGLLVLTIFAVMLQRRA